MTTDGDEIGLLRCCCLRVDESCVVVFCVQWISPDPSAPLSQSRRSFHNLAKQAGAHYLQKPKVHQLQT